MGSNLSARRQPAHTSAVRDYFKGVSLEAQVDAAEAVRELLASPGWAHVMALVDGEVHDLDLKLDADKPLEHVEYAHLHGQRRGLGALSGLAHAIVSKTDDRLAEERERNAAAEAGARR